MEDKTLMKHKSKIYSVTFVIVILGCVITPIFYVAFKYLRIYFPEAFTSPLNPSTVSELCTVLDIDPSDPRCTGSKEVYAFHFFPEIRERYSRETPRQIVDDEIGSYLVSCENHRTLSDGGYTKCHYDFQNDGVYTVEINYELVGHWANLEEVIWKLCTPAVRESPDHGIITSEMCN